jgi:hypothetical protein
MANAHLQDEREIQECIKRAEFVRKGEGALSQFVDVTHQRNWQKSKPCTYFTDISLALPMLQNSHPSAVTYLNAKIDSVRGLLASWAMLATLCRGTVAMSVSDNPGATRQ